MVELLAVIAVLSIIAFIAVLSIGGIIEKFVILIQLKLRDSMKNICIWMEQNILMLFYSVSNGFWGGCLSLGRGNWLC